MMPRILAFAGSFRRGSFNNGLPLLSGAFGARKQHGLRVCALPVHS